ncbi:unnamed protein product [Pelagomonas calceolata]|uniref:Protochlorophyllide reductase n=1 Tax=Pelagomonas calceolata TaxID=35677 RepID=A0A8J2X2W9_9STRA|nr:unnamed protein product [Pelagomonas calceolata]
MLPVTRTASSTLSRLGSYLRLAAQTPVVMCSVAAALAQPLLETLRIVDAVEPVERDADLRNKTILVTGATAGVGLATCKRLAARGARVLVCGRNAERTRRAVEEVGGRAEAVALDLCSLESVRACAEKVKPLRLDVLILNAGVNANVPTATHPELDCSLVFGVNFVAHYLLVTLLLDSLGADARVVCLASAGAASIFHAIDASQSRVDGARASTPSTRHKSQNAGVMHHHSAACHAHDADYAESKLAMVLLARALSRGDLGRKVDGVPVNPGAANSDIWRHVWAPVRPLFRVCVAPVFLTTDQACASSVAAAALPLERDGDGLPLYLAPYWVPRYGCRAAFEYVGYFVGSGAAFARVPAREHEAAEALFARCRGLLAGS